MDDHWLHAFAAFLEPRRAVAARGPQAPRLPAAVGIVDAAVEALGIEAERIRHPQRDHLAVLERDQPVVEVAGRHRHVVAEAEGVVLVDPGVVARLGAVLADAFEARSGILIERPALRTMVAGRLRPVQRRLALAPVEAADVAAGQRDPHHALAVDVAAARSEAGRWDVVDLRERGFRRVRAGRNPDHGPTACEHADGEPDRSVDRARRHCIGARSTGDAHVLVGIHRLARLGRLVALAVAVGVEHERGPALRLRRVSGLLEHLGVDPADHAAATAARRPQRIVGVVGELQVMGGEAGVDEGVLHRLGIEHRDLPLALLQREELGGRMVGTLAAERRILGAAHRRGEPQPAFLVDHRIVVVDPGVPDLLVTPIRRRPKRLLHRRVARPERFGHLRVAHGRMEVGDLVGLGVEDRNDVGRVFRRAEQWAIAVDRWVTPIGGDQVVEVVLVVAPVPGGDDEVALEPLRALRLIVRQLALGDAIGPVGEVFDRDGGELAGQDVHHQLAGLARLHPMHPGFGR